MLALRREDQRRRGPWNAASHKTDDELVHALHGVHKHRGRGVSENDWDVQREAAARACGVGWVRSLHDIELPFLYGQTLGAGRARRLIVRMLMLGDAQGWLGVYGAGERLAEALRISKATWWRAVAWLELHGWLCRVRTYKTRKHGTSGATVDFSRNLYVPGPTLLRWRSIYRSELAGDRVAYLTAVSRERAHHLGNAPHHRAQTLGDAGVAYVQRLRAEVYECAAAERARGIMAGCAWTPDEPADHELPQEWEDTLESLATDPRAAAAWERSTVAALSTLSHDESNHLRWGESQEETGPCTAIAGRARRADKRSRVRSAGDLLGETLGLEGMWSHKTTGDPPD